MPSKGIVRQLDGLYRTPGTCFLLSQNSAS